MPDSASAPTEPSPSGPGVSPAKLAFIEDMGLAMENVGLPRMAGRVLGALLIADPPEMSADDLAATLQASRGSISTSTRLLEAPGLIERVTRPGDRRFYYRNRPDAWHLAMQREARSLGEVRRLAERGLATLETDDPEVRRGLEDMHAFYAFMETEMATILDHWSDHRRRRARDDDP